MNAIEYLKNEHKRVKRIAEIIKHMNYKIVLNEEIDYDDFFVVIECIRKYADAIHHKKEEDILFKLMIENLPEAIARTINFGMLVEHDQGRFLMSELEVALNEYKIGNELAKVNIIANSIGYANMIERHIYKEDEVLFKFADKELTDELKQKLNSEFEIRVESEEIEYYLDNINELELKYVNL